MPFGKWRGHDISEIPGSYLDWLLREVNMSFTLDQAVKEEVLTRRSGRGRQYTPPPRPEQQTSQAVASVPWEPIVQRWHHRLVMAHHPDRGGDNRLMAIINDAVADLKEAFRQAAG